MTAKYQFRDIEYKTPTVDFTFEDESSVRDAFWNVEQNDCILDIGAGLGSYTLTALAMGAKQVFAWEPSAGAGGGGLDVNANYIKQSLHLNGWDSKCIVYPYGLFDQAGWLDTTNYRMQMISERITKSCYSCPNA